MENTAQQVSHNRQTRQAVWVVRFMRLLSITVFAYGLCIDIVRWQHHTGIASARFFALHALLCSLWLVLGLLGIWSEGTFTRGFQPSPDTSYYAFNQSSTVDGCLLTFLPLFLIQMTVQTFMHGRRLLPTDASYLTLETLLAIAGTVLLNILYLRRILRKRKRASTG